MSAQGTVRGFGIAVSLLLLGFAGACAMPQGATRVKDENPAIVVQGAPVSAQLFVDGIAVGRAKDYSGEYSLTVLPGRHLVEVRDGSSILLRREIFVSEGVTKTLVVSGGR